MEEKKTVIPTPLLHLKARQSLKGDMPFALFAGLIALMPSIITNVVTTLTGGSLMERLYDFYEAATIIEVYNIKAWQEQIIKALNNGLTIALTVQVLMWFITPALTLGLAACMLELVRGHKEQPYTAIFCRLPWAVKAIGLNLLIWLKAFLWGIPGVALYAAVIFAVFKGFLDVNTASTLVSGVMMVIVVPVIIAMMRYAVALFVLADKPKTRLMSCIRESKQLMQNHKLQMFSIQIFFIFLDIAAVLVGDFIFSITGGVISDTVSMLLQLIVNVYLVTTQCAFYESYSTGRLVIEKRV